MTLHRDEPSTASARQPEGTADPAAPVDEAVLVDEFATDDVAPHDEAGNPVLDKVVFGVAAAIVLAFIAWGVFATDNLSAVAKSVLGGTSPAVAGRSCSPRVASSSSRCGWR